jgi:hypothetical protein
MGIFSSKIKTYVGTSISRVNDARAYTRSSKIAAVIANNRNEDLIEHAKSELASGPGFKATKYFNLAAQGYINGIPSDTTVVKNGLSGTITTAVEAYLTTLEGTAIDSDYVFYGPPNYFHLGWKHIYEDFNYEPSTDELPVLSLIKGYTVTLTAVNLLVSSTITSAVDISCFYSLGFAGTVVDVPGRTTVGLQIEYEWVVPPVFPATTPTLNTESMIVSEDIDLAGLSDVSEYYQSKYTVVSTGVDKFFEYQVGTGITSLDSILGFEYDAPGTYYPWVYFRSNFTKPVENTLEYTQSAKLCKRLGFDYKRAVEAIHDLTDRSQSDLDEVVSSFIYFAVPADATSQVEKQYLYKYFDKHFTNSGGVVTSLGLNDFNTAFNVSLLKDSAIVIRDAKFKVVLSNRGIFKREVVGSIGALDSYDNAKGTVVVTGDADAYTYNYHVFRKQTNLTEYTEYQVIDLTAKYNVSEEYYATSGWTEDVEDEKDILLIPIDKELVDDLRPYDREELCYMAQHIVNNSLIRVKVRWYQRGAWLTVFKVIALIMLINGLTQGFDLLLTLLAIAEFSVVLAIQTALYKLFTYLVITFAAKLFVSVAGEDLAILTAIILTLRGMTTEGFKSNLIQVTAKELVQTASLIIKSAGEALSKEFASLGMEMKTFYEDMQVKFDELKKLQEEMGNPTKLAKILVGESVDSFYNRTIHTNNIGVKVFDIQHSYVDLALQLPRNELTFGV